jgi:hypothetical protein
VVRNFPVVSSAAPGFVAPAYGAFDASQECGRHLGAGDCAGHGTCSEFKTCTQCTDGYEGLWCHIPACEMHKTGRLAYN